MNELDWEEGWLRGAVRTPSPNQGARPDGMEICLAVIHSISLPPGEFGGDAVEQLFMNALDWDAHPYYQQIRGLTVSSHFLIRRTGALQQFVSCERRAWHAGRSMWQGRPECNDYAVGIELEGLEGDLFETDQYDTLVELLRCLARRYPLQGVAGHEHVAPGRKHDPGPGFEWSRLMAALRWPDRYFPPEVLQRV